MDKQHLSNRLYRRYVLKKMDDMIEWYIGMVQLTDDFFVYYEYNTVRYQIYQSHKIHRKVAYQLWIQAVKDGYFPLYNYKEVVMKIDYDNLEDILRYKIEEFFGEHPDSINVTISPNATFTNGSKRVNIPYVNP